MAKRKYKFNVTNYDELKTKYPLAVETKTITVEKASYAYLAKLADCGLEIPGVTTEHKGK